MIKTPHLAISSRGLLCSLGVISSALLLSGCQDEDHGFETQEIRNSVYLRNFEKTYGKIAEDQIWDFSSYNLSRLGLAGGPSAVGTRAGGASYSGTVTGTTATNASEIVLSYWANDGITKTGLNGDNYYKVDDHTIEWLNENLVERNPENIKKGNPFTLAKPTNGFAIIPIYQGHTGLNWQLHLVDKSNNKDYTIWQKSKDLIYFERNYYGEEIFYSSLGTDRGGDVFGWTSDGKSEKIKIGKGFTNYSSSTSDYVGVQFEIPAGKTVKGYFADSNGDNRVPSEGVFTIPSDSYKTGDGKYEVWLGNYNGSWNDLSLYITEGNDLFNSFSIETERARIKAHYNYEGYKSISSDVSNATGHTVNRREVHTKPIFINPSKIEGDFYLYLKITSQEFGLNEKIGACQRSDEGMMIALALSKPNNIGNNEYMIIGCEDLYTDSDWDANDIVFLLIGNDKLPKVKETISKRYMIEDLGSTFDFDFNDIVLDVEQRKFKNYDGTYDESMTEQKAYLRHLSGTIPFKITVGNTPLGTKDKYEGRNLAQSPWRGDDPNGDGFDPASDRTYYDFIGQAVTGWNPNTNNITVTTWPQEAGWSYTQQSLGVKGTNFTFPQTGKYPYIIACDITTPWTQEMVNVPNSWFTTWNVPTPNPGIGGGSGSGSGNGSGTTGGNTPSDTPATQNNTLTFSFADASEAYSIIINNVEHVLNGSNSVPVSDIAAGTAINVKVKSANNDNIDYNVKYELTVNGNTKSGYGGQEINNVTNMPSAITTVTIKKLYQVMASIKNGPSQKWQSDDERHGKVQIVYNGQVVSNDVSNNNPQATAYLPKGASFTLVAIADQGYEFDGWYENRDNATRESAEMRYQVKRESNATTYFRSAIFKPATTNYHVVVTAKPSGWGQVKIGDGNFGATAEGYYASGTNLTLYAQANNDYTFIKWTNSETTNSRTLNVTGNNTPDAIFGMNLFSGTWGLQDNYDFAALGSKLGNDGNGNQINIDIVKNVNTENSTLIFYFDSNIDNASFKFYLNRSNDDVQITPTSIKKDGQKLFVNMSNAVNQIQYNGFYMRISGLNNGTTINVKKVCVAPASAMPAN